MVAAGNSSYLWFSDEETQAGGSVIQVMSVKKSVHGKQTLERLRSSCILKENQAEIIKTERYIDEVILPCLTSWLQIKVKQMDTVETHRGLITLWYITCAKYGRHLLNYLSHMR